MAWYDNSWVAAAVVGGIIVVFYFFGKRGEQQQPTTSSSSSPNNATQQQQQQANQNRAPSNNAAAAVSSGSVTAGPRPRPRVPFQAPQRIDDLTALIAAGKHKNWTIMLHTRSNFASIPASLLRDATSAFPNLMIVHQVFSEKDVAADTATIKENVDTNAFPRHNLVVCTTDKGVEAIARQTEPAMLISDNRDLLKFMATFVTFAVLVDPQSSSERITTSQVPPLSPAMGGARAAANQTAISQRLHIVGSAGVVLK